MRDGSRRELALHALPVNMYTNIHTLLCEPNVKRFTGTIPANTKHLYNMYTMLGQRRRRWADIVYMSYKSFVFFLG